MARLKRTGPLPDDHLLQIKLKREREPTVFEWLESLEVGKGAPAIRSILVQLIQIGVLQKNSAALHLATQHHNPGGAGRAKPALPVEAGKPLSDGKAGQGTGGPMQLDIPLAGNPDHEADEFLRMMRIEDEST